MFRTLLLFSPTWTSPQVFDVNLLLLHTRGLTDQTGVVVGVPVCGTDWILIVSAAVNVTYAPKEKKPLLTADYVDFK